MTILSDEKETNMPIVKYWRKNPKSIEKFQFIYHFLPHPDHRRRATLLSNKALLVYCALILLVTGIFRLIPSVVPGVLGYASSINMRDLLEDTNKTRTEHDLPPLRLNEKLTEAAQAKAADMFNGQYWAHVSPKGTQPWDFILAKNYDYIYAGENLAKNFSTSQDVVTAWYDSPSHRENLLSSNYDEVGFAVVNGVLDGYETTLVVQMFGRPRDVHQLATVEEEDSILNKSEIPAANLQQPSGAPSPVVSISRPEVLPAVNVSTATKYVSIGFATFIVLLLSLDLWYSRKRGITKLTGHTLAHITLLIMVILGIWIALKPGLII